MSASTTRMRRRAAESGAGHTDEAPARNPGATAAFALFGEVLLVGTLIALGGILIITLPAAFAAGSRHLVRFVRAEGSPLRAYWADYRRALPGGFIVGGVSAIIAILLAFNLELASSGALPGGVVIGAAGVLLAVLAGGALLGICGAWDPESGWRTAVRATPQRISRDVVSLGYLTAAAGFVVISTWMFVPLLLPALGCAALAIVAIPRRKR